MTPHQDSTIFANPRRVASALLWWQAMPASRVWLARLPLRGVGETYFCSRPGRRCSSPPAPHGCERGDGHVPSRLARPAVETIPPNERKPHV